MSLFWINKWHIETSLDMMNAWDTQDQIESKTREKLEEMKKWVEKELKEDKISTKDYKDLLNKWLETYKTKITKDTQSKLGAARNDVWEKPEWKESNKEGKPEEQAPAKTAEISEVDEITINGVKLKKWDTVFYDMAKLWVFTWKYKKVWEEVTEVELIKDSTKWEKVYIKTSDITSFWKKTPELEKPAETETKRPSDIVKKEEEKVTKPKDILKTNTEIHNLEKQLYSNYKNWKKIAEEIDSSFSWFTKTEEIIGEDSKKLKEAYVKMMWDIHKYLTLKNEWVLTKEKTEWVYQILNEISYFYADEHELSYKNWIDNDHNKNYELSIANCYIILNWLSTTDWIRRNLVNPPTIEDILKKLKWTKEWDLIIAHIKQWKDLWEILSNWKIKWAFDKVYENLYWNYEKQLSKEITWIDNKLKSWEIILSKEQIEAFDLLKNIQWEWWITDLKSRNKENIFLMAKSVWAVWAWILAMIWWTALTATWIWVAPWSVIAIWWWALVWWAVTTAWMMFAQDRRYSLEEWVVEMWINSWMFFVWWLVFKVWWVIAAWRPLLSLRWLTSVTVQWVWDVAIWVSSDQIRAMYKWVPLDVIDSIKYNLVWALLPILMQWKWNFSQNRINLANKTKKDLERAQVLETMWDNKWARKIRDEINTKSETLRKAEEPQTTPVKSKETANSIFSKDELEKIRKMNQSEYATYLRELPKEKLEKLLWKQLESWINKPEENIKNNIYELITRKPELRWMTKDEINVYLSNDAVWRELARNALKFDSDIWLLSRKYSIDTNFRDPTTNSISITTKAWNNWWWYRFYINESKLEWDSSLKWYITFNNSVIWKSLTKDSFEKFILELEKRWYNWQVKTSWLGVYSDRFDTIVFHWASQKDIDLAIQTSKEVFPNNWMTVMKWLDRWWKSHSQILAEDIVTSRNTHQWQNNTNVYWETVSHINTVNLNSSNLPKSYNLVKKDLMTEIEKLEIWKSITIWDTTISKVKTWRKSYYEVWKDWVQYDNIDEVFSKVNINDLEKYVLAQTKSKILALDSDIKLLKKWENSYEITKDSIVKIDTTGKRTKLTTEEYDLFIKDNFDDIFKLTHWISFNIWFPKFIDKIKDFKIWDFIPSKIKNSLVWKKTKSWVDWSVNLWKSVWSLWKNILVWKAWSLLYWRGPTWWLWWWVENLWRKWAILSWLYYWWMYLTDEEYQKYVNENPIETWIQIVWTAVEFAYLWVLRTILWNDFIIPGIDDAIFWEWEWIFDDSAWEWSIRFLRQNI